MGLLVGRDLVFRGQRQAREVVPGRDRMEPRSIKTIALQQRCDTGAEALQLRGPERGGCDGVPYDSGVPKRSADATSDSGLRFFCPLTGRAGYPKGRTASTS